MQTILRTIMCAWCLVALGTAAWAQSAGPVSGVVRDATGGVLPGATVTLSGASLSAPQTAVTDAEGRYEFANVAPGSYIIEAALSGFDAGSAEVRAEGGRATVDLVLAVSSLFEKVTVTATKTGETDVQQTPIAITAIAGRTLEQTAVQTVETLAGVVPTLTVSQNTGLAQLTIRGIGTNAVFAGSDPSSTIHLDGVYLGRPAMVFADFLNLERLEVLRGPQGTLYGRNSVGGTINIVTRKPTNTLEGSIRLTAGNYARLRTEGAISGPLVKDKVMANFAFIRGTRDGFVKNLDKPDATLGSENTWAGRGQVRFVLPRQSELLVSADYGTFDGEPLTYAKPVFTKPGFTFNSPASLWEVRNNQPTSGKNTQQGASAKLSLQLSDTVTVNSLTAWRNSNYHLIIDSDITELTLLNTDIHDKQRQVSQELTVVQHMPKLTWIAGTFIFDEHDVQPVEITLFAAGLQSRPLPDVQANAWALFGQGTYKVAKRLSLTGGVRYTNETKDLTNAGGLYRIGTTTLAVPASFYNFTDTAKYDAWTPKAGIEVQAARDTFLYVSATRGFKSGGFNQSAPEKGRAFSPEFAWSYEGGVKTTVGGGRLRLNTALFYNDYQDLQVQSFIRPGVIDITNAASAKIKGLEVEASAAVAHGLQIGTSFSWLDATYDEYVAVGAGGVLQDASGKRLNNAPEWSGNGTAIYEFATGQAGSLALRGDMSWQSRVFFTPFNDTIETQTSYGLLHLRAGFTPRNGRWELAVYARNIGNQEYITGTGSFPPPAIGGRPGDPRNWGTQFTLRY